MRAWLSASLSFRSAASALSLGGRGQGLGQLGPDLLDFVLLLPRGQAKQPQQQRHRQHARDDPGLFGHRLSVLGGV